VTMEMLVRRETFATVRCRDAREPLTDVMMAANVRWMSVMETVVVSLNRLLTIASSMSNVLRTEPFVRVFPVRYVTQRKVTRNGAQSWVFVTSQVCVSIQEIPFSVCPARKEISALESSTFSLPDQRVMRVKNAPQRELARQAGHASLTSYLREAIVTMASFALRVLNVLKAGHASPLNSRVAEQRVIAKSGIVTRT